MLSGQAWRIYHTCLRRQKDQSPAKEPRLFLLPSLVPQFPRMSLLEGSVNRGNALLDSFVICDHG